MRGRMQQLKVPEECPQEVSDLFDQCVAEDPSARPTAKEVLVRLTQVSEAYSPRAMAAAAAAEAAGANAVNGEAQKPPSAENPAGQAAAAEAGGQAAAPAANGQEGGGNGEADGAGKAGAAGDVKVFKVHRNAPTVASPFEAMQGASGSAFQPSPFASSSP